MSTRGRRSARYPTTATGRRRPAEDRSRDLGQSPRDLGLNPRALGTNPNPSKAESQAARLRRLERGAQARLRPVLLCSCCVTGDDEECPRCAGLGRERAARYVDCLECGGTGWAEVEAGGVIRCPNGCTPGRTP